MWISNSWCFSETKFIPNKKDISGHILYPQCHCATQLNNTLDRKSSESSIFVILLFEIDQTDVYEKMIPFNFL